MVINLFSIELENSTRTFAPGSTISGKVKVSTSAAIKTSKVSLHAIGQAHIIFSLIPDEVYFSYELILWHAINYELQAGHHEFPFVFILPATCPRSVDGGFGSIKYSITARIHGHLWFNRHKRETINFNVIPIMNLAPALSRSKIIIDKQGSWFSNKCLRVMVTINKRVFSRHETVALSINVSNDRSSRVKYIETAIRTVAHVARPTLTGVHRFQVLSCLSHRSIQKVNVPELCRSHHVSNIPLFECLPTIKSSSLFQIRHYVHVKVSSAGLFDRPLVITCQIVIYDNMAHEIQLPIYERNDPETSNSETCLIPNANGSIGEKNNQTTTLIEEDEDGE